MHCSHCGAILADDASAYCGDCGTLIERQPAPGTVNLESGAETVEQTSSQPASPPSVVSAPVPPADVSALPTPDSILPAAIISPAPTFSSSVASAPVAYAATPPGGSGWAEFSNVQTSPPITTSAYPPPLSMAGAYAPGYMAPGTYTNTTPNLLPPGVMQPVMTQTPQRSGRRWPFFILGMIVGIVITLVFGSVVVGLRGGQPSNSVVNGVSIAVSLPTSVASSTPDPNLLYQQITSQSPTFVDALQDPTISRWGTVDKPTYGCNIQSDGLHVRVADTGKFYYCTSGRGKFAAFAFQVEMKMLKGNGGGILFSSDNQGNEQYFHMYPDGSYDVFTEQNHKFGSIIAQGTASLTPIQAGIKSTLAIIVQGNEVYLYLNRKLIKNFQDATYTSGFVGVGADDKGAPAEVVYTNAQLWMI